MEENPLIEASRKYQKLQEYTEKLANAAHRHPEVAYDRGSTPSIGAEFTDKEDLTEEECLADMKLFSYLVSNKWQETQEYFIFELQNDLKSYLDETDEEGAEVYQEAFESFYEKCQELDRDIAELDRSLDRVLDKTPSQKFEEPTLEPAHNTLARSD
ncbi:MAG: hypothetical protein ACI9LV_000433 [Candidatus Nanohaloarchaea archaeon]|jgi:hypothetical protein